MNIEKFFSLSDEEQAEIVKKYEYVTRIRNKASRIKQDMLELHIERLNLQNVCKHINVSVCHRCNEDEYGRRISNSSYKDYNCPDCGKNWKVDA